MNKKGKRVPAWERMVREGLVADRAEAERWILAGKVHVGAAPVRSAGEPVELSKPLSVQGLFDRYISKGGYKLEGALRAFSMDLTGRVAIDAGACTGGFTDCLVQSGCARVYAVDVGFGQLHGSLRQNPAVVNLERTNISDEKLLSLDPKPNLGTVDLSYLSLRKGIPAFSAILHGEGELLCLVKPLFEIDDPAARREGVIAPDAYAPLLASLCADVERERMGFVTGITHSPVTGNGGTVEFFLRVNLAEGSGALRGAALAEAIDAAVAAGLSLERFRKGEKPPESC